MPVDSVWPGRVRLALGVLVAGLIEFLLFDRFGAHHHTGIYPRWNDQIQYLTEAYLGYENAQAHGLFRGLYDALTNLSAQGTLHDFWAILIFKVAGPSRSAALSLNMLAFLVWQLAVFLSAWRATRSVPIAAVAASLLLTLQSGWAVGPGSTFDFRLDWFATCTMGLALVAAEQTDGFRRTPAAITFGAAVALVLLTRFLTGTYFVLIYSVFTVWVLFLPGRWIRLTNLILSGLIATAVAGPILWINREVVYNYYLIGHLTGPESALRSSSMGIAPSTRWLCSKLVELHVGLPFWILSGATLLVATTGMILWPERPSGSSFVFSKKYRSAIPAIVFFVVPALVLILHLQKSEYVLGVLLPGLTSLVFGLLARPLHVCGNFALRWIAVTSGAAALGIFSVRMVENPHAPDFLAAGRRVASISDYIVKRSSRAGLTNPRVAVDRITDCLDGQVLRVICYERQRRWIPFIMTLPTGIREEDPKLYWDRLKDSDFVFLSETGNDGAWPYDHQLARMRPQTLEWANSHLRRVDELDLPGVKMVLFERTDLP